MKNLLIVICICAFLLKCSETIQAKKTQSRPPNIIYLLADDLGYAELGCYGQKWIKTPNIDKIASEGIRFTQHYCGNAVCAPSRCCLITGKHPGHAHVRNNGNPRWRPKDDSKSIFPGQNPIPDSEVTIAEVLKQKGYATAAIGKWGLGYEGSVGDPNQQGFDLFYGFLGQRHAHNHYPRFLWNNGIKEYFPGNDRKLNGKTYSQDKFAEMSLQFIKDNKDRPFFLYVPYAIPHLSIQVPESSLKQYKGIIPEEDYIHKGYLEHPYPRAGYAAMISHMDRDIGNILKLVSELKLDDNTIIMFSSDNGPTYKRLGGSDSDFFESAGPFKGLKGSLYEGGIRVPMVARWPGKIQPGTETDHLSAFWDVMPTIAELTGTKHPEGLDGISFAPTLLGKPDEQSKHEYLYWEFSAYGGQQAVRMGKWKAVRQNMLVKKNRFPLKIELYDLSNDLGESNNVAAKNPDVVNIVRSVMKEARTQSYLFPFRPIDK
jgi:arylsulfatase A-like enzyme